MSVTFTDLLKDPAFAVKNRKQIKELYDLIKKLVKEKKLNLEGHTLPASFNDWIVLIEGNKKLPKRDTDVVDFSLAQDKKYESWRKAYLIASNPVLMSQAAKDLLESVQELETASTNSMSLMNGNKDDVVTALSDMQAAIAIFLNTYDKHKTKLQLPNRDTALERIKIAKTTANKMRAAKESADPKVSQKKSAPKELTRKMAPTEKRMTPTA